MRKDKLTPCSADLTVSKPTDITVDDPVNVS